MHNVRLLFPVVVLTLGFLSGSLLGDPPADWQAKMKGLADVMSDLLPELYSANGDRERILKDAKTLTKLTHDLKMGEKSGKLRAPSDADPTLFFLSERFSDQMARAHTALKQKQFDYGKGLLKSATAYCIACHTRHDNGPEFPTFPLKIDEARLDKSEKAELFVATRQFDRALVLLKELVANEELAQKRVFEWERPLRTALAISVRVKKDPTVSAELVAAALATPGLPEFERARLRKWVAAIDAWKREPKVKTRTEAGDAAEMRRLLREAQELQLYPMDRAAEIQYLRASTFAHDVLRTGRDKTLVTEALLTAGAAYEALSTPVFWPLHEMFYEACIRRSPHTAIASDCYERYEQSVYVGYTGSAGTDIPTEVVGTLDSLKALAAPKDKKK